MHLRAYHEGGREEIEALQLARLRELLVAIVPANRFYAEKLAGSQWRHAESLDEYPELIPYTLKRELVEDQLRNPPYGTDLTYPVERYSRFSQTSGTTGTPMRWLDTADSWDWMIGNWTRVFRAAGVSAKDRVFFAFGLRVMLDNAATVLCCTPTYALRLAEVAAEEKIDLRSSSVRTIIVSGEPGGGITGTRERIESLWSGARVVDHHGMTEVGPVSYGCPERKGVLHVIETSYYAEVIDPATGKAVQPGQRGELVLTTLGRFGSPLLRYRTGDIVERDPQEGCSCGSYELALPGGILGRADDIRARLRTFCAPRGTSPSTGWRLSGERRASICASRLNRSHRTSTRQVSDHEWSRRFTARWGSASTSQ